jgi:hypothetical protein
MSKSGKAMLARDWVCNHPASSHSFIRSSIHPVIQPVMAFMAAASTCPQTAVTLLRIKIHKSTKAQQRSMMC